MKLYILRHGDAGVRGDSAYPNDDERPLSSKGIKRTEELARQLKRWKIEFDVIMTSPLVRARETAEIVARGLREKDLVVLSEQLAPSGDLTKLVQEVNAMLPTPQSVLWVGHEPSLGHIISRLCTSHADLALTLKKGGLCRLDIETLRTERCAYLEWLLAPGVIESKRK